MPTLSKSPNDPDNISVHFSKEELDRTTSTIVPPKTPIIRYMNLSKFYSLMTSKAIWFPRVDQFSDEYEGFAVIDTNSKDADYFRKLSLVSCWNHYHSESFPLWKIYLGNEPAGVAIISTVGNVLSCIKSEAERDFITPLLVQYVVHDEKYDGINNELLISRKKNFYEFEQEIRFNYYKGGGEFEQPIGKPFEVDPEKLINEIILSPYMSGWIRSTFEKILEKFGYKDIPVKESKVKDKMLL